MECFYLTINKYRGENIVDKKSNKKIIEFLNKFILIITILLLLIIITFNLVIIIRIMFFGWTVGSNEAPDTIWWGKVMLKGINGIKTYYSVWKEIVLIFEIPISIICIIYQIIYFKVLNRKRSNINEK